MQSFWTLMTISSLGAQPGSTRQVPMQRGRGDYAAAEQSANTAGSFAMLAMSVVGLLVAVVAVVFGGGWKDEVRFGLVLLGLTAPLRLYTDTHEVLIQSVKRFDVMSATVVLKAILALVLQTAAVWAFGFYGMFLGVVCIEVGGLVFWYRSGIISRDRPAWRFQIDRARLGELISFGAPILVYAQVWLLFQAVDQLIIASALNLQQLGFYALAVSVTTYILYLPKTIGGVVFPRMAERFGQTGKLDDIHHYATNVQRMLAYVLVPLAVAGGFFLLPVLVPQVLPSFQPSIEVIKIMVAASFFMALMNMPIKVLMTAGYRWSLTAIAFACLVLNAGLNVLMVVVLDKGLEGAALATAISYFVTFAVTTGFSLSRSLPWRTVFAHIGEIVVVFAYCYVVLRGLETLIGDSPQLVLDVALAALKFGLFCVAMIPWLWVAERRVDAVTRLRKPVEGALGKLRRR